MNPDTGELTVGQKRELLKQLLRQQIDGVRYPLSFGQRALWFLHRLAPESATYNVAVSVRVEPPLDLEGFESALREVVSRHEPLRSVVVGDPADPGQELTTMPPVIEVHDARAMTSQELSDVVAANHRRPFECSARAPLRAFVFRGLDHDVLLISSHHINVDARSSLLLVAELRSAYEGSPLPPLTAAYRDFVYWQRDMLASVRGELLGAYWSEYLAGDLPVLRLRCARDRPAVPSNTGGSVPLSIEPRLLDELRSLAREHRGTLFSVVLLAWSALLSRESGQPEIVVGTPASGRTRPEWAPLIGCFVNTLPIRVRVDTSRPLVSHLPTIIKSVQGALEHQDFPLTCMVDRRKMHRIAAQSPLFQTMLNVVRISGADRLNRDPRFGEGEPIGEPYSLPVRLEPRPATITQGRLGDVFKANSRAILPFGSGHLESFPLNQQEGQFDWVLELAEFDDTLEGSVKYSDDAGTAEDARRLARSFLSLLVEMTRNRDEREEVML